MKITRFEDIEGWQLARKLANCVYDATETERFSKDFALRDQIQRAASSAMHNIAEGFDSGSNAEFVRFLKYAQRSCSEIQSELYLALDRKYVTREQFDSIYQNAAETRSKLGGFIRYLRASGS